MHICVQVTKATQPAWSGVRESVEREGVMRGVYKRRLWDIVGDGVCGKGG